MTFKGISLGSSINLREEDNLSTRDKWPVPKVSSLRRFTVIGIAWPMLHANMHVYVQVHKIQCAGAVV